MLSSSCQVRVLLLLLENDQLLLLLGQLVLQSLVLLLLRLLGSVGKDKLKRWLPLRERLLSGNLGHWSCHRALLVLRSLECQCAASAGNTRCILNLLLVKLWLGIKEVLKTVSLVQISQRFLLCSIKLLHILGLRGLYWSTLSCMVNEVNFRESLSFLVELIHVGNWQRSIQVVRTILFGHWPWTILRIVKRISIGTSWILRVLLLVHYDITETSHARKWSYCFPFLHHILRRGRLRLTLLIKCIWKVLTLPS